MKNIFTSFILLLVFTSTNAQTTELAYSLGMASSSVKITSMTTDAVNNIYVCGSYSGTGVNFNPLGTDSLKNSNGQDAFIAKYNASGLLQRVITFGGSNIDEANKVYIDQNSNVYMLASVIGSVKFAPTDFGTQAGAGAIALVKYNTNLQMLAKKLIRTDGGAQGDKATDIKVDGAGNIFLTGNVMNANLDFAWNKLGDPLSSFIISPNANISTDIFVAKLNTALVPQWVYHMGGNSGDEGAAIDLDNAGNIYLTGIFRDQNVDMSPNDVANNLISESGGFATGDVFVAKYNSTFNYQWAFNIGDSGIDAGTGLLVNKITNDVYVSGFVNKQTFTIKFNPASTTTGLYTPAGGIDMFVASYTSAGAYRWHRGIGGLGRDSVSAIALDASGNVLMTGVFEQKVGFASGDTITATGNRDVFLTSISAAGITNTSFKVGGAGNERGTAIAYSSNGRVLLAGEFTANGDYDPTALSKPLTVQGNPDSFIAKYVLCSKPVISQVIKDTSACAGATNMVFKVTATGATSYQWKKDGVPQGGATASNQYTIAAVALTDAKTYSVDAINTCGTVTSNEFIFTVNTKPVLPTLASTASTCQGVSVSIDASATTGSPAPAFSWTKDGGAPLATTTSVLTIASPQPVHAGVYKVKATNVCGSLESSGTTLTINTAPVLSSVLPATKSTCQGVSVSIDASATTGSPAPTFSWTKDGGAPLSTTTSILTIASPQTAHAGVYKVKATNTCGSSPESSGTTLTVNLNTAIATQPIDKAVCTGANTTLSVSATGTGLTYQWKKGPVTLSNSAIYTGVQTSMLGINTITKNELGSYTVEVTGTCGTNPVISDVVSVAKPATPITIITQPSPTKVVTTGQTIILTVSASNGSGVLTYQWKKGTLALTNGGRISGATSATLQITNAATTDSDDYTCVISSTCAVDLTTNISDVTVTATTGITDAQAQGFKISPNPATDQFLISNDHVPFKIEQIELISPQGVSVLKKNVAGVTTEINEWVNIQGLSPAVYIVLLKGEGQQTLMKVVVEK